MADTGPKCGEVRILVVGEPGVGKTSMILSLSSSDFVENNIPEKAPNLVIPPDVTPDGVLTTIVDYSSRVQSESDLYEEMHEANAIIVVYAVDNIQSIEKIKGYWLPLIRFHLGKNHGKSVMLVGNKVDLVEYTTMDVVVPLMNEFNEVENCIECSAKTLRNISEIFFYAQKSVTHPTQPLYDSTKKEMTEKCKLALERIFKICDADNDGILSDEEMISFQNFCYGIPLTTEALQTVKQIIKKACPDAILNDGITLYGFVVLHTLFIQRGKHETTWACLRKFGYDDDLTLSIEYLYPCLAVPSGCSTELNQYGFDFLTSLFMKYDQDRDGCLSPTEFMHLFSLAPSIPWRVQSLMGILTDDRGWITFRGFISNWVLTTYLDVNKAMAYLAYLGYPISPYANQVGAISVSREKRIDVAKRENKRNVLLALVVGAKGVGKTTVCQGLIGRSYQKTRKITPEDLPSHTVNVVEMKNNEDKYLILHEIDVGKVQESASGLYDVICLVYNQSDSKSFEFIARAYLNLYQSQKTPVVIIGNSTKGESVQQEYIQQPREFCSRHKLSSPIILKFEREIEKSLYDEIVKAAIYPQIESNIFKTRNFWIPTGIGAAIALSIIFSVLRHNKILK